MEVRNLHQMDEKFSVIYEIIKYFTQTSALGSFVIF